MVLFAVAIFAAITGCLGEDIQLLGDQMISPTNGTAAQVTSERQPKPSIPKSLLREGVSLLIPTHSGLRLLREGSSALPLVVSTVNATRAVDYHFKKKEIFFLTADLLLWTKHTEGLGQFSTPRILVEGVAGASGLAVDWLHDTLYWCHGTAISMATLDISDPQPAVIFNTTGQESLHDIAVDPYYQRLFWLRGSLVESAGLQGEESRQVLDKMSRAESLAVDLQDQRLYVAGLLHAADTTFSLVHVGYDGSEFKLVLSSVQLGNSRGLGVQRRMIYWSQQTGENFIYSVSMPYNPRQVNATKLLNVSENVLGIRVYHADIQTPSRNHECWMKNCSHPQLCVRTGKATAECRCPPGWTLTSDLRTCQDISTTEEPPMDETTAREVPPPSVSTSTEGTSPESPSYPYDSPPNVEVYRQKPSILLLWLPAAIMSVTVVVLVVLCACAASNWKAYNVVAQFRKSTE